MFASFITILFMLGVVNASGAATILYILGAALILTELTTLTTFGILAFNGVLAVIAGYMIDSGADGLFGLTFGWPLFFGVAAAEFLMLIGGIWLFLRQKDKPITTGTEAMIGQSAVVLEWKGKRGRVRIHGEEWAARSDKALHLKPTDNAVVRAVENLTLVIESDHDENAAT